MKTALITGARGFIGRHLAAHLGRQGVEVLGLGHGSWTDDECEASWVARWLNGDVTRQNLSLLAHGAGGVDCVIHLAGGSSVGPSIAAPEEDFRRSVVSTLELLEWVRTSSASTVVVFASSAAVYGTGHAGPIPIAASTRPTSPYGAHKRMAEELCASHCRTFGLKASVARLFSVYGPGLRKQLLWDVCGRLSRGCEVLEMGGTGREQRDFLHVSDAARLLAAAAHEASVDCPTFNGGTGHPATVRQVVEELVRAWGSRASVAFSGVARAGDPESLVAELGRMPTTAPPSYRAWREGLCEYVSWFRREGKTVP